MIKIEYNLGEDYYVLIKPGEASVILTVDEAIELKKQLNALVL